MPDTPPTGPPPLPPDALGGAGDAADDLGDSMGDLDGVTEEVAFSMDALKRTVLALTKELKEAVRKQKEQKDLLGSYRTVDEEFEALTKNIEDLRLQLVAAKEEIAERISADPELEDKETKDEKKKENELADQGNELTRQSLVKSGLLLMGINKLVSEFKQGFTSFINVEKDAALINRQVTGATLAQGKKLAESIGEEVSIVDALRATYKSQQAGVRFNTQGMHNLFKATLRTGENFEQLAGSLLAANLGIIKNNKQLGGLASVTNRFSGILNLSRTQLVAAMNAVSDKLKDTQAALGANAMAFNKGIMALRGFLRSDAMHKGVTSAFEDLLMGNNAIQKSLLLGVRQERLAMLGAFTGQGGPTGFLPEMLTVMQKGAERTETLLRPYAGTDIAARMVKMFDAQGRTSSQMLRAWEAVQQQVNVLNQTENKRYGIKAIVQSLERQQEQAKEFTNTFNTFKSMVMVPLMNAMVGMAERLKGWLKDNKDDLRGILEGVAHGIEKMFRALLVIASGITLVADIIGQKWAFGAAGTAAAIGLTAWAGAKMGGSLFGMYKGGQAAVGAGVGGWRAYKEGITVGTGLGMRNVKGGAAIRHAISSGWGKMKPRGRAGLIGALLMGGAGAGYAAMGGFNPETGEAMKLDSAQGDRNTTAIAGGIDAVLNAIMGLQDTNTTGLGIVADTVKGKTDTGGLLSTISGYAKFQVAASTKIVDELGKLRDVTLEGTDRLEAAGPPIVEVMVNNEFRPTARGFTGMRTR